MKKDKIFIIVFSLLFVTYVVVDFFAPEPISWAVTFRSEDKNPFGSFILNDRSPDIFTNGLELSTNTLSELKETESNILIIAESPDIFLTDEESLFEILERGGNVLIAANTFPNGLLDTLDLDIDFEYQVLNQSIFEVPEKVLEIGDDRYTYPSNMISNHFKVKKDSIWQVIGRVEDDPVAVTGNIGSGQLTLVSVPLMFTNFGMLLDENYQATAQLLSYLPKDNVHYTMFYGSGRKEAKTPFRYFLREDALRWALYLGIFLIALFLIVSSRRKQRAIPVVAPPANTTVQYVKTLGSLFFRERNHRKAAEKIINHFLTEVRERYFVQIEFSEKFYSLLSAKSNVELEKVIRTFELIDHVKKRSDIEEKVLIDLSRKIETFK